MILSINRAILFMEDWGKGGDFMEKQSILLTAAINIPAMLIMAAIVWNSHSITRRQRNHFCLVYLNIVVIILLELIAIYVNRTAPAYRWLNILSNYLGFSLIPLVPVVCAGAISDYRSSRWLLRLLVIYGVIMLFSSRFHIVFAVDENNCFHRGRYYWFFVAVYGVCVAHLAYMTAKLNFEYQNSNLLIVGLLIAFLVFSTVIQILNPKIYVTWTCASLMSVIYYIYCTELWLQVDGLTSLLNHGSYLRRMGELSPGSTLILFDVDKFKQVNDTHGHLFGDAALKWISKCIRNVYGGDGLCYRIGGDEFAVIVARKNYDPEEKRLKFQKLVRANRVVRPGMPDVSLGWAVYKDGMSTRDLIGQADRNMYDNKHEKPTIV